MITVVEKARSTNFTTLAKFKSRVGITGTDRDEDIRDLIAEASDSIVAFCNRKFAREAVTETLQGYGRTILAISRTPVVRFDALRYKDDTLNPSGYVLQDPEAGFLYNEDGWQNDQPIQQWIMPEIKNEKGPNNYSADYTGGYLMPDDDITASGIAVVTASDSSFNLPGTGQNYWPLVASGESIIVAGFADDANNGTFVVTSRTRTKLTVAASLVDATASGVQTFRMRNLPRDLESLCIQAVRFEYYANQRDPGVKSESIGDWSASYVAGTADERGNSGLPAKVEEGLTKWLRIE